MSTKIDILLKSITLLHREKELEDKTMDSKDLIRTVLSLYSNIDKGNHYMGGDSTIISDLKYLLTDMINNPDSYDKISLLDSLELIFKDKPEMIKVIENTINREFSQASLKRTILSLKNKLNNYYRDEMITSVINKASYQLNTGKIMDESRDEYVAKLIASLEALTIKSNKKDPAIMDELDIGDESAMGDVLSRVKGNEDNNTRLTTGWKELNVMTQGGFRKGTTVMINALQHNYKSGMAQSLFMQLAMHNKPVMLDPEKKPLITYISCEDDSEVFTEFMYRYLYYNEHKSIPDLTIVTGKDIATYIKQRLSVNGYHVKLLRVNPSLWTYKDLQNKILEFEANGFEVHACIVDYLSKLAIPNELNNGPFGTGIREVFNRCRNFFSSRSCLFITPHQLSVDAKRLMRSGITGKDFLDEVANKGYLSESQQIDQIVDLELYIAKFTINRKWFLGVRRGKDRQPGILDDEHMYFTLPFPKGAPIAENINEEGSTDILDAFKNNDDDKFDF